jgi:hypothetical protein
VEQLVDSNDERVVTSTLASNSVTVLDKLRWMNLLDLMWLKHVQLMLISAEE